MSRKPKPKNTLSAGERVALYQAEREEKQRRLSSDADQTSTADKNSGKTSEEIKNEKNISANTVTKSKVLPKPQHGTVKADFSVRNGKIKPMHGMCNGPVSYGTDISHLFREIGVPVVRFDGTDGAISSYAVDISRIFRDKNADPTKPESYDFSYTDKYVAAAYNSGAKVIYRLGESRDRMGSGKKILLPDDIDLWAHVCVNVIRHYNDYWAGGFAYGIEYFEIWNHDDALSVKELAKEFELYRKIANTVKIYDESIKVGGLSFDGFGEAAREFLKFCRKNRAYLDFITLNSFSSDPEAVGKELEEASSFLINLGFGNTEMILGQWSYIDNDALGGLALSSALTMNNDRGLGARRAIVDSQASVKGAAYAAALMLRLNAVSVVSAACFYDAQPIISLFCSMADRFGDPQKPYYAFHAFGDLYRARNQVLCVSEQIEGFAHSGIYASAAISDSGEGYVLISSFGGCGVVDLRLDGIPDNLYTADIYMLDGVKDMSLCDSVPLSGMKKRLLLNISEYGVVLVKLY